MSTEPVAARMALSSWQTSGTDSTRSSSVHVTVQVTRHALIQLDDEYPSASELRREV